MDTVLRYAVAYARVSTEDQAKMELSVPAQFRRMEEYAKRNNIKILYRDADEGVSAFKDNENREAFWRCVGYACEDRRVTLFLIDDSARFIRDKYLSGEIKGRLRKHGVKVLITSNPYDTGTIHGVWMESIDETRSQTFSMQVALDTIRGMEQNIRTRDPETGWCFKNGGRAPFGYRAIHVIRGQDKRGRDIVKTLWEIDEDAAEVKRFMYVKRSEDLSYKAIWKLLNLNRMPGPTPGKPWTISSIIEMMRRDRVLQDAGYAVWNKEDHHTPGRRFKDESEWVWVENAHPPIINLELANKVISVNQSHSHDMAFRRSEHSPFLLTGKNIVKEDMFICLECGARMTGYKPSKRHRTGYICGSVQYRGAQSCISRPIDQTWIERFLLVKIKERYGTKEEACMIADRINNSLRSTFDVKLKNKLVKQLGMIDGKIQNLVRAVANGLDLSLAKPEIDSLKQEKNNIELELKKVEQAELIKPAEVTAEQILGIYRNLENAFAAKSHEKKRKLLRAFVHRLEYDPKDDSLQVYLFTEPVSSAVWHSSGAQDRAHYEYHIDKASQQRL